MKSQPNLSLESFLGKAKPTSERGFLERLDEQLCGFALAKRMDREEPDSPAEPAIGLRILLPSFDQSEFSSSDLPSPWIIKIVNLIL